jgi:hypothetical protein
MNRLLLSSRSLTSVSRRSPYLTITVYRTPEQEDDEWDRWMHTPCKQSITMDMEDRCVGSERVPPSIDQVHAQLNEWIQEAPPGLAKRMKEWMTLYSV